MYQLKLSNQAEKALKKIDKKFFKKAVSCLEFLKSNPLLGQKMSGDFHGSYRIKIPPLRIIYKIDYANKIILIRAIGHRQGVYK